MKIAYLGVGTWGYCLAYHLASLGHDLFIWSIEEDLIESLQKGNDHPHFPGFAPQKNMHFTCDMEEAIQGVDLIVEGVTSAGIRPVFKSLKEKIKKTCPLVLTSKGIEQKSGLLLPEVLLEVMGEDYKEHIACLSGPSHAEEVMEQLPTSIVSAAYNKELMFLLSQTFASEKLSVYPNSDIIGVAFGGAMKNIIAVACGISDGMGYGINYKAALMTRGLHEMRKLASLKKARPETLNGLSGMGDLCVTCLSPLSRNFSFGKLIGQGMSREKAKEKIGVVVEGAYSCVSALELGARFKIELPITEMVHDIIYGGMPTQLAMEKRIKKVPKEEHL